jgi:DNA invertase Pin-like site-specific DNA recombinase
MDWIVVTRPDRLARSTRDLLNTLDAIGRAGASFKSLNDAWADTTTPHGKLMITVLAGLAEFERSLILARTGEGRARAKAQALSGRPASLTPFQQVEALRMREEGKSLTEIGRMFGCSHSTISRLGRIGKSRAGPT